MVNQHIASCRGSPNTPQPPSPQTVIVTRLSTSMVLSLVPKQVSSGPAVYASNKTSLCSRICNALLPSLGWTRACGELDSVDVCGGSVEEDASILRGLVRKQRLRRDERFIFWGWGLFSRMASPGSSSASFRLCDMTSSWWLEPGIRFG